MENEEKAKEEKIRLTRNAQGKISGIVGLGNVPEPLLGTMASVPLFQSLQETVETLDRDMTKSIENLQATIKILDLNARESSKKVEKLTLFLSGLTVGLLAETAVLIYLTYLLVG